MCFCCLTQVQGTNDSSVVSKVSAAAQGYFKDAFLQHFVCKVARRAPLINRSVETLFFVLHLWDLVNGHLLHFKDYIQIAVMIICCRDTSLKYVCMFRGYYVRWRAVDHCVRRFLHITENCPRRQVS